MVVGTAIRKKHSNLSISGPMHWSSPTQGCRRNSKVYRKIAKELTEVGYTRTMEQCRDDKKVKSWIQLKTRSFTQKETTAMDDVMGISLPHSHQLLWTVANMWMNSSSSGPQICLLDNPSSKYLLMMVANRVQVVQAKFGTAVKPIRPIITDSSTP